VQLKADGVGGEGTARQLGLYPRVGFIVTNLAQPAERVVAFYNQRGTARSGGSVPEAHAAH
jgi:hypothetical protein